MLPTEFVFVSMAAVVWFRPFARMTGNVGTIGSRWRFVWKLGRRSVLLADRIDCICTGKTDRGMLLAFVGEHGVTGGQK